MQEQIKQSQAPNLSQLNIKNCPLWSQYTCVSRYIQVFKYWIYYGSRLCSLDKGHLKNCVVSKYVLLRPKNFVRHFQGPDMKCKLPLSTNNLALLSLLSF
jgi:hypothetical protein